MRDLRTEEELERSAVVANCRMNRERRLDGSNSYARELGFRPMDLLAARVAAGRDAAWLDLCCGRGFALLEAAREAIARDLADRIEFVGVDLVGHFPDWRPTRGRFQLVATSIRAWEPGRRFDLISCVHGLHYVGDKLGLIARAAGWLAEDGLFAGQLDLANIRLARGEPAGRRILPVLRGLGVEYESRRRLITRRGPLAVAPPWHFLGADEEAGPNYTGQPAVDSYYEA